MQIDQIDILSINHAYIIVYYAIQLIRYLAGMMKKIKKKMSKQNTLTNSNEKVGLAKFGSLSHFILSYTIY